MQDHLPKKIIYKGKLHFDSVSHINLEKRLNFRWKEQNTISSHVDVFLNELLTTKRLKDKKSLRDHRLTFIDIENLLVFINSDEFRQITQQAEYSGWKSLINQITSNLDSSQ